MESKGRNIDFDIPYGLASIAITSTGVTIITTTGADYHGLRMIAGSTQVTFLAYDNASTASGNLLDVVRISPGGNSYDDRFNPVKAKSGIVVSVVGTGGTGVVFYTPKG